MKLRQSIKKEKTISTKYLTAEMLQYFTEKDKGIRAFHVMSRRYYTLNIILSTHTIFDFLLNIELVALNHY